MASFDQHIAQCNRNLLHLYKLNSSVSDSIDWQVTTCFYTAVHLVNAYLAECGNLHYKTHSQVESAINPFGNSIYKFSEQNYLAYEKIKNLSRRSRYMCHEEGITDMSHGLTTTDKHLSRALKNLDILLQHFNTLYNITYPPITIVCSSLSSSDKLVFITNPFAQKTNS